MQRNLDFEINSHDDLNKMLSGLVMDLRRHEVDHDTARSISLVSDKIIKNSANAIEYRKITKHDKPIRFFEADFENENQINQ